MQKYGVISAGNSSSRSLSDQKIQMILKYREEVEERVVSFHNKDYFYLSIIICWA